MNKINVVASGIAKSVFKVGVWMADAAIGWNNKSHARRCRG